MSTEHPLAILILTVPGWRARLLLGVLMAWALGSLPLPIAGIALWIGAVAYMTATEELARRLIAQDQGQLRLEADLAEHVALLAERDTWIEMMEIDLVRMRAASVARQETDEDRTYRQVGLHRHAPEFLIVAARRSYRMALHPDRNPRHGRQAHERFLRVEAIFDRIEKMRS